MIISTIHQRNTLSLGYAKWLNYWTNFETVHPKMLNVMEPRTKRMQLLLGRKEVTTYLSCSVEILGRSFLVERSTYRAYNTYYETYCTHSTVSTDKLYSTLFRTTTICTYRCETIVRNYFSDFITVYYTYHLYTYITISTTILAHRHY